MGETPDSEERTPPPRRGASKYTVDARAIEMTIELGVELGIDRRELLEAEGLPADYAFDPDLALPYRPDGGAAALVMARVECPDLGIRFAENCVAADYHALGFAVVASRTVREGIVRTVRYSRMLTTTGHFQLLEGPKHATVTWYRDVPRTPVTDVGDETAIAQFLQICRLSTGIHVCPELVTFRHAAPPSLDAHHGFFGCRVLFDSDSDSLCLDPTLLDRPLGGADEALVAFFEGYLLARTATSPSPPTLLEQVRRSILTNLATGVPTAAEVARNLGMSDRSLRRHLGREGETYRGLLQSVRFESARALLQDPRNSIAEVAFLLGYADAGAFSRAFRRETGRSPKAFRSSAS